MMGEEDAENLAERRQVTVYIDGGKLDELKRRTGVEKNGPAIVAAINLMLSAEAQR